ncbi:UspA domain protein [Halorubrum aidingense JCM 13560]|uniref:UspA domain protein n=1 Tax=Halorubrum aidingense JCM 13560 TaxID=1230454 RepID=M0PK23_9EURY|nr:universal stress protein [Halorubrum aidingense]EMA69080.1 UspA domain protein [Halorubrum aidingense JCM 13560]
MISRVLVPMDESEMAERALRYAFDAHPNAEITVVHVVGEPSSMMGGATEIALADDPETAAREHAGDLFDRAEEIAAEHDVAIETRVTIGHPARAVINMSDEFDVVVIGSHSGSLADRLLVGNIAEKIVRGSAVPVTVVR